jgi:uroporphyrinogen decarboxylase
VSETMTPRERALAAFRHEVPDAIPAHVFNVFGWEKRLDFFGARSLDELADALGNTIVIHGPPYASEEPGLPVDGLSTLWGVPDEYLWTYTDTIPRPLAAAETVADVDAFAWPTTAGFDFQAMREGLIADTTHARLSVRWMPIFSRLCELFGMEQAMVNLRWNRPVVEASLARLDDFYTDFFTRMLDVCGDQIDIFGQGDDFADNRGLLLRPDLWRLLFRPLYAKYLGMAKATGLPTLMHSCGRIVEVLPDLIDSGLDAWQTVQTHLPAQDPATLKRQFGRHLVFVGAIDTTNVLTVATPAEVREHVRRQIGLLAAGGGYVCAADHSIFAEVPNENVAALFEAVAEFRGPGYTLLMNLDTSKG